MVTKNTIAVFGVFLTLLVGLSLVSAASNNGVTLTINPTSFTNVTPGQTYPVIATLTNLNGTDFNLSMGTSGWTWNDSKVNFTNGSTITLLGNLTIPSKGNKEVIAKLYNETDDFQFEFSELVTLSYYEEPKNLGLCDLGDKGDLEFRNLDINNLGAGGDNDWEILDEIEITIEIENTDRDNDVDDVIVELIIQDSSGNDVTRDFDLEDEEIDLGRIKDRDYKEAIFVIKEVPADMEEGNYRLFFRAYSDEDEDGQCVSTSNREFNEEEYHEIEVVREDDPAVIVRTSDVKVLASCGDSNVEINLEVINIGSEKEEKILVTLENIELGIDERIVIDDLRSGKQKELTFFVNIPEELDKDKYDLEIKTYFDWDDDEDEMEKLSYDENSDDINKDFSQRIEIIGCKGPEPSVGVNLVSESVTVGSDLVVRMVVKNNDDESAIFLFSASNFESWADLTSVNPQSVEIAAGATQEVLITLNPKEAGLKSFNINAIVDGETYVQPVSVNVGEEPSTFGEIDNLTLYLIIGIIALIILILVVIIIKALSRPKKVSY